MCFFWDIQLLERKTWFFEGEGPAAGGCLGSFTCQEQPNAKKDSKDIPHPSKDEVGRVVDLKFFEGISRVFLGFSRVF